MFACVHNVLGAKVPQTLMHMLVAEPFHLPFIVKKTETRGFLS